MEKFTNQQPKKGQIICTCGHKSKNYHWYKSEGIKIQVPKENDLTLVSVAYWIELCPNCHKKYRSNPHKAIKTHYFWQKEKPHVTTDED
jgi:hypothetical protein